LKDVEKYNCEVVGIEYNEKIYNELRKEHKCSLLNQDFLEYENDDKFDLIIGNPPYFVVENKNEKCMTGRGNIFVMFIYKCLTEHLNKDGYLAFVLPTSFYNCKYYEPCRKYIKTNTTVVHLENVDAKYIDTAQNTMIMILKNTNPTNEDYIVNFSSNLCLNPYHKEIKELMKNASTLKKLECTVKTGEVVWNQHKEKLTNDEEEGDLVIYSHNIVNNKIVLKHNEGEKKQYINNYKKTPNKCKAIIISRGYGNKYTFSYAVHEGTFFGENHVNVIIPKDEQTLNIILKSLEDERTKQFIEYYVGNGALSKTEIETILPIFL
jgi:tRNA1(Val) A37 N6-methylase TrmN6